ncbi:hypothetical protein DFA_11808 [Cavenderia fasciculata]|uniref:C2H2-type domain-containing protein n=1 Tax=Cavenderia fasciculata TaxID=261658 RepID=F4QE98_CACFS|nr:uncharacterized protein DFA_11808 [Cavenderia fasciculata]EGG14045.1 hypothetical protein DFA_11808 [Cavenderia fasciculata]|eukprot:XP_004350753.1 hypothetical protein DFA_11808 [Cavenderia fasciculata]
MARFIGSGGRHAKNKSYYRATKTANRKKDIDQIWDDMQPGKIEKLQKQEIDVDKPAMGQIYCIPCAKYFVSQAAMDTHSSSKPHKKRVKSLLVKPYSVEDSVIPIDNGKRLRPKDDTEMATATTSSA